MADKEGPLAKPSQNDSEIEDPGISMVDVLQDEESLGADAKAVLGNADDKNCSYHSGGYMKRQALYSCLTCTNKDSSDQSKGAGICLACSYHCHEDHELVELYTKRNFRCDCGNSKLDNECKLANDKFPVNEKNKYNQNFKGDYCICHRPYPDPEDTVEDEMIQCVLCEDWYHGRHLLEDGQRLPNDANYAEMVCFGCFDKFKSILAPYVGLALQTVSKELKDSKVAVVAEGNTSLLDTSTASTTSELDTSLSFGESQAKKCKLECKRLVPDSMPKAKTLFLTGNWRQQLCKCDECVKLYQQENLAFLTDEEDTVHHYESQAKNEGTQYEKGMEALSAMDRVKQVEAIHGYNSMKSNLMEHLKKFAENKKVVSKEDIQEFFQQLQANKRPRSEIPKFCK